MPNSKENSLTELQAEWLAVLKACASSGQSMVAYAKANNLGVKDLYSWKKVLVTKGFLQGTRSSGFVKAAIKNPVTQEGNFTIVLPNGVSVVIPAVTDEVKLADLLRSVMQL